MFVKSGTAWIGLEQNIIDTAINKWRKRLFACIRIVGQHFKQFYYRQLKMDNWINCQPQCQKFCFKTKTKTKKALVYFCIRVTSKPGWP